MRIPGGHSAERPSKNNFQLPRARDRRANALARMIHRVGLLMLLVPRCLFLFFPPPPPSPSPSASQPPPLPSERTTPARCTARRAAPAALLFFSIFRFFRAGRAGHTAANRWCAAQQVADYKNHSTTPGGVLREKKGGIREKKMRASARRERRHAVGESGMARATENAGGRETAGSCERRESKREWKRERNGM